MSASQPYREHLVSHQGSNIYVRHYEGTGPAFVMMHGFPDNLHIYDRLILALPGRQVITFDFLGWGASDKPTDYPYTSKQQEGELHAVLDALQIDQVVPVAHDASGPVQSTGPLTIRSACPRWSYSTRTLDSHLLCAFQ